MASLEMVYSTNRRFEILMSYESALLNGGIISTSLSSVIGTLDFRLVLKRRADLTEHRL